MLSKGLVVKFKLALPVYTELIDKQPIVIESNHLLDHMRCTFIILAINRKDLEHCTTMDTKINRIKELELVARTGQVSCIKLVACGLLALARKNLLAVIAAITAITAIVAAIGYRFVVAEVAITLMVECWTLKVFVKLVVS